MELDGVENVGQPLKFQGLENDLYWKISDTPT